MPKNNITGKSSCGVIWEEELETIRELLSRGAKMKDLTAKYECSESTIRRVLDSNNIAYIQDKRNPSKKQIQRIFDKGNSVYSAAKIFNIPINSFCSLVVDYDLTPPAGNLSHYKIENYSPESETKELVPYGYFDDVFRAALRIKTRRAKDLTKTDTYYFVPELGIYVVDSLLKKTILLLGINFREWECKWVLGLSKEFLYTEVWAEKYIATYHKELRFPGTIKEAENRIINRNFTIDFTLTRKDFEEEYKKSRINNGKAIFDYDFSKVPKTVKNFQQLVPIVVKEINTKTGVPFDTTWMVSFNTLVLGLKDYRSLFFKRFKDESRDGRLKHFLLRAHQSHSIEDFDYSLLEEDFVDTNHKVRIICNTCGTTFSIRPLDFVDPTKPCGCPNCSASTGEQFIESWLRNHNIEFQSRKAVYGKVEGRNSSKVVIDTVIDNLYGQAVWIEYNGRQHYEWIQFFHKTKEEFDKQLLRDKNVREYCKINNILFIEVPYTLGTLEKVSDFLNRVLLNGEPSEEIIDYKSLYKL